MEINSNNRDSGVIRLKDKATGQTIVTELFYDKLMGEMLWKTWLDSVIYKNINNKSTADITVEKYDIGNVENICKWKTDKQVGYMLDSICPNVAIDVDRITFARKQGYTGYSDKEVNDIILKQPKRWESYSNKSSSLVSLLTQNKKPLLTDDESCHVERIFTYKGYLSYLGSDRIVNSNDVAWICRQLETAAVENSFCILIKEDKAIALHLGIGNLSETMVDTQAIIAADSRINADKIYFIHNHPSGNVYASNIDMSLWDKLKERLGNRLQDGIIINTTSGKYGTFNNETRGDSLLVPVNGKIPIPIYSFDTNVFSKDYSVDGKLIRNSDDVAAFLSSQRLGERDKLQCIVINTANRIIGNFHLKYSSFTEKDRIAKEIADGAAWMGGRAVIIAGSFDKINKKTISENVEKLNTAIKKMSCGCIKAVDVILTHKDKNMHDYISCADEGYLSEPVLEYGAKKTEGKKPISFESIDLINIRNGDKMIRCKVNGIFLPAEKLSSFDLSMVNKGLITKEELAEKYFKAEDIINDKKGLRY